MKLIRAFMATILFLSSASASARIYCDRQPDHASERACLEREAEKSTARVKALQVKLIRQIKAWDEEPAQKSETLRLFLAARDQYLQFRTQQCEYEGSVAAGGNGATEMALDCEIKLDDAYTRSIKAQANWFGH